MAASALSELTKMPNLPLTNQLKQPKATPEGMIGPAEVGPVLSELGSAESEAALKVAEGDIAIKEAERQDVAKEAKMKVENLDRFSKEVQAMPERTTLQQAREDMSAMSFVPTKDNATDLAAMFSLIKLGVTLTISTRSSIATSRSNLPICRSWSGSKVTGFGLYLLRAKRSGD